MDAVSPQIESLSISESESEALYSLVAGEGDGFMLGVAAGDAAGGAWELGYSAVTEQVTIISYELIEHRRLDAELVVHGLRELDGSEDEEPVFRAETPHFRAWLDRAVAGVPVPEQDPSLDGVPRATPLGIAFRHDAEAVTKEATELGRLFHSDAGSVAAGVISASAVAASCFGQSGRDLLDGVAETVMSALSDIGEGLIGVSRLDSLEQELTGLVKGLGAREGQLALDHAGGNGDDPIHLMLAGLLLAAPMTEVYHAPIEQAARIGGSRLGAAVGAVIGARVGIRAWPWAFANDTWFAEIGRRLVRGPDEVRDLPIPYAVEHHLMSGGRPDYH